MTYIDGYILPVPTANRQAFVAHATAVDSLFLEHGASRIFEAWGDDVPDGKLTDFRKSVQAADGENVVFAWVEWPDKATRDAGMKTFMEDERLHGMPDMPFDGQRMIMGGFDSFIDESTDGKTGYADGYVLPVPKAKKDAYRDMAQGAAAKFKDYGALRVVEAWGDDVPDGKVTDYKRAVKAEDGESIVYSYVEWPDKATRDAGWAKMMEDPDMPGPQDMPFDGKRMFWGGFEPLIDRSGDAA